MRAFAELFQQIDQTNSTNEKVHLMQKFFREQDPETSAWAVYLLVGRRPKKLISSAKLRVWLKEFSHYPEWLLDDCYSAVGDTAEMVALIMGHFSLGAKGSHGEKLRSYTLAQWMDDLIFPLGREEEEVQKKTVIEWWQHLLPHEIFLVNKFLTGALRVGVSEALVYRALEKIFEQPRSVIASRLLGQWQPSGDFFKALGDPVDESPGSVEGREVLPKPFCLAAGLEGDPQDLGDIDDWQIEWKWDGIRCQAVKFGDRVEIWSRGEERVTDAFPDMAAALVQVPGDWILDGELVAGDWKLPALFQELQQRLNRKKPSAQFQSDHPVSFIAYDFLVDGTEDLTSLPLRDRRRRLEEKLAFLKPTDVIGASLLIEMKSWDEVKALKEEARLKGAEGLMIKNKNSVYATGRKRGIWFKWKLDPLTVDAVLTSAQPGSGRRASLYTDYTFSIWKEDQLVPIAKAYSGLTDEEIRSLDGWIRKNTVDRFGPVRAVKAQRVFEIGFEGIAKSTRHKSGYAVRFPRILRERTDKPADSADRVDDMARLFDALRERAV